MESLSSKPVLSPFQQAAPHIEGNRRLREPQRQAYIALKRHFEDSHEPALAQIPVGCGKSGLMAILPFGIAQRRVLLVAPNVTIREGLFQAVDSASPACFWRRAGVTKATPNGPFAAKIDGPQANLADCRDSHFVVTNVQQLGTERSRWASQFPPDFFDMVLIDEGHHNAAKSWQRLFERFPTAKFVSLTATPFRSDGQELTGKLVYRYPFLRAMSRGYIKKLSAIHVAPQELAFTMYDEERECSLDEVLQLREETWFSRGIALAPECNRHIVLASVSACQKLREQSHSRRHQIIAAACSVEHAVEIAALYQRAGYRTEPIHSGQPKAKRRAVLKALLEHRIDAIVQVQMLGEGFDHPPLSVAAVFRPYRSLSPYIQFVGRVMRTFGEARTNGRQGIVVSHVGLNIEQHWDDFRALDEGDQSLWAGLASGGPAEARNEEKGREDSSGEPKTFDPSMLVARDVIGHWYGSTFAPDQDSPHDAEQMPLPLLTSEQDVVRGPQQKRREARSQLEQSVDEAVRAILSQHGLHYKDRQISILLKSFRRYDNWTALRVWIYGELNKTLRRRPGAGKEWSLPEVEIALQALPNIVEGVNKRINRTPRRSTAWRRYDRF